MNTFVIEEFFVDGGNACNFYTVRWEDAAMSETERFLEEFDQDDNRYLDDAGVIITLIDEIADRGTRLITRPRDEAKAFALPPEMLAKDCYIEIFGNKLRLYYVLLSENIIVLLGGGIAHDEVTGKIPKEFGDAQSFAKRILAAKNSEYECRGNQLISTSVDGMITIF